MPPEQYQSHDGFPQDGYDPYLQKEPPEAKEWANLHPKSRIDRVLREQQGGLYENWEFPDLSKFLQNFLSWVERGNNSQTSFDTNVDISAFKEEGDDVSSSLLNMFLFLHMQFGSVRERKEGLMRMMEDACKWIF